MVTLCLGACAPDADDDAGPSDDAGAPEDAGAVDAGPHDGGDPCAAAGLDPALGSLSLATGFSVVDSAPLSPDIVALSTATEGADLRIYAVDGTALSVVNLGAWPALEQSDVLFDLLPADFAGELAFASYFLARDGERFAAGYTGDFDPVTYVSSGELVVFDAGAQGGGAVTRVSSENIYAGAFAGDTLVVSSYSLDGVGAETALYALLDPARALATFEDGAATLGGPVVATADGGLVVAGYGADGAQHFFRLSAADVATAVSTGALSLSDTEEVLVAPSLQAARFGDALAYLHGDFFNPFEAVRRVPLADGVSRAPQDVLIFEDACTTVDLLADAGDDLLVGVSDANGRRLVRVRDEG